LFSIVLTISATLADCSFAVAAISLAVVDKSTMARETIDEFLLIDENVIRNLDRKPPNNVINSPSSSFEIDSIVTERSLSLRRLKTTPILLVDLRIPKVVINIIKNAKAVAKIAAVKDNIKRKRYRAILSLIMVSSLLNDADCNRYMEPFARVAVSNRTGIALIFTVGSLIMYSTELE